MKISKVKHTKFGVSTKTNANETEGVLYRYPGQQEDNPIDLQKHVKERYFNSQKLYSIITENRAFTEDQDQINFLNQIAKKFNNVMSGLMYYCSEDTEDSAVEKQIQKLENWPNVSTVYTDNRHQYGRTCTLSDISVRNRNDYTLELEAPLLAANSTRSSLRIKKKIGEREVYLPDIIAKLMIAVLNPDNFYAAYNQIDKEELKTCLQCIDKDYRKEKQLREIAGSIENQDVRVGVIRSSNGMYLLEPSNAHHKKKKHIFEFMKKYAGAATQEERNKQLKRMRELIVLFFCGKDFYDSAKEIATSWTFGVFKNKPEICFDKKLEELIGNRQLEKSNSKCKEYYSSIVSLAKSDIASNYLAAVNVLRAEYRMPENEKINSKEGFFNSDFFWMDYIERVAQTLINPDTNLWLGGLNCSYLCEQTWKTWTAYIATKFIDYGKAVYHFALPDFSDLKKGKEIQAGNVLEPYRKGISSFDYEWIKAEDSLERDISEYLVFAINNFASSCISPEDREKVGDILMSNIDKPDKNNPILLYNDADIRIMRYFGGMSSWREYVQSRKTQNRQTVQIALTREGLFRDIKTALYQLRNTSFHYSGSLNQTETASEQIKQLFMWEYGKCSDVLASKYYSNNIPMFYTDEQIKSLSKTIYKESRERPAQIPAFGKVFVRSKFQSCLSEFFDDKEMYSKFMSELSREADADLTNKYRSAVYFLMKEIYYNVFIHDPEARKYFDNAIKQICDEYEFSNNTKYKYAAREFSSFVGTYNGDSLGKVCQALITEYMLQNSGDMCVHTEAVNRSGPDKSKYENYRFLLNETMKRAFREYLKKDEFDSLRHPSNLYKAFSELDLKTFCGNWQIEFYKPLLKLLEQNANLYSWYIFVHFIHPKQLNHLIGSLRNYIQFCENIEKRAQSINNTVKDYDTQKITGYRNILMLLSFMQQFVGRVPIAQEKKSAERDYFKDSEAYAEYLSHFVAFENEASENKLGQLKAFCDMDIKGNNRTDKVRLYHDPQNIILNRNVVLSDLYGASKILSGQLQRITYDEIQEYYSMQQSLEQVFINGECHSDEELKARKKFIDLKNRVELYDLTVYSETINELIGQLISWAYLRERDAMYFQLGYYYTKIFFSSVKASNKLRRLTGVVLDKNAQDSKKANGKHSNARNNDQKKQTHFIISDGAVLYQIIAVYTYPFYVICYNKQDKRYVLPDGKGKGSGPSARDFNDKYMKKDEGTGTSVTAKSEENDLYEGAELFERSNERLCIRNFRNFIDHFCYFSHPDKSILDLYSEVYDNFFTYDPKLRKSVPIVLQNILARNMLVLHTRLDRCEKTVTLKDGKTKTRHSCHFVIARKGIEISDFTYKYTDRNKVEHQVQIPAHSQIFCEQMRTILEYSLQDNGQNGN